MLKILPVIFIVLLIGGGLIYWRISQTPSNVTSPQTPEASEALMEVPKTLPGTSLEDRVKSLESSVTDLIKEFNSLKSTQSTSSLDSRLKDVEGVVTELKARVAVLEKGTPVQSNAKSSTVYIPLGSGGQNGDKNWLSINNYGAIIDPAEYPGYSSMQLEVNFRLIQKNGTAYARFYNVTDSSAKEQVSTTSDSFVWQTSYLFTLPSGKKTYTLQLKSSEGVEIQVQSARIKVNF